MIKTHTLNNGLRVIHQHLPHAETISVSVWVDVGSRHESKAQNGISHFLEHMAFKGTSTRNAKEIAEIFDAIGGHFNAGTSREFTSYYAKTLPNDVDTGLEVIADILQDSIFSPEEIENEREVILQELAMTEDTPDDIIFDHYQTAAFNDQPLGRPILGHKEFITKCDQKALNDYFKKHYTATSMVVSFAGNLSADAAFKKAEKYFHKLPNKKNGFIEDACYHGGTYLEAKSLEQTHILIGFPGLSYHDNNRYALELASIMLGGGMSSRLFQEIREKHGLAYSVSSFHSSYKDTGIFTIYAGISPDKAQKYCSLVSEILKQSYDQFNEEELARAKSQIITSLRMGRESTSFLADYCGRQVLCYGKAIPMEEIIDRIHAVTTADAKNILANICSHDKPTVAAIGGIEHIPDYEQLTKELVS